MSEVQFCIFDVLQNFTLKKTVRKIFYCFMKIKNSMCKIFYT